MICINFLEFDYIKSNNFSCNLAAERISYTHKALITDTASDTTIEFISPKMRINIHSAIPTTAEIILFLIVFPFNNTSHFRYKKRNINGRFCDAPKRQNIKFLICWKTKKSRQITNVEADVNFLWNFIRKKWCKSFRL